MPQMYYAGRYVFAKGGFERPKKNKFLDDVNFDREHFGRVVQEIREEFNKHKDDAAIIKRVQFVERVGTIMFMNRIQNLVSTPFFLWSCPDPCSATY
jgi:hypothetical protein